MQQNELLIIVISLIAFAGLLIWNIYIRMRAEAALRVKEQQLEAIFEHSPAEIYIKDVEGRYVRISRQFEKLFNVKNDDLVGKLPHDAHYKELADSTRQQDLDVLRSGEVIVREELAELENCHDGLHTLLTMKFPIRDKHNQVTGLGAIVTDITERVRVEQALRASEQRFREFSEIAADWYWEQDAELRFIDMSEKGTVPFGVTPSDRLGKRRIDLKPDNLSTEEERSWRKHQATLEAHKDFRDFTFRLQDAQGAWRVICVSGRAMFDADSTFTGYRGVAREVTETERARQSAITANEALLRHQRHEKARVETELAKVKSDLVEKAHFAAIGQVAASVAHDLRNPLGAIRNAKYYLNRRVPTENEKWREYLQIIEEEVVAADSIINELMEFTRDRELKVCEVELESLLSDVIRRLPDSASIEVQIRCETTPFILGVDPIQFGRVLDNLLNNAVQAIDGTGTISVHARHATDCDIIRISDDGPGIDVSLRDKIFTPLVTGRIKGTGLGLAICHQVLQRHGGEIRLINLTEPGTTFEIQLPPASKLNVSIQHDQKQQ